MTSLCLVPCIQTGERGEIAPERRIKQYAFDLQLKGAADSVAICSHLFVGRAHSNMAEYVVSKFVQVYECHRCIYLAITDLADPLRERITARKPLAYSALRPS